MADIINTQNVWIGLNITLVIYALIIFFIGKYSGHKDSLSFVTNYIYNYYLIL